MDMIRYCLYNILLFWVTPVVALYLWITPKNRRLLRRFWPDLPSFSIAPIWIHACSIGEVNTSRELIRALEQTMPDVPIILSVSTLSAFKLVSPASSGLTTVFAPFDLLWSVRGFIRRLRPRILIIIETELWPNLVREAHRNAVPVVLLNGRLSTKAFSGYIRYKGMMPPIFNYLNAVATQDDKYAERFSSLGMLPKNIEVTGNMKNDTVLTEIGSEERAALLRENGFSKNDILLIFGSTRPGDEQLAFSCWLELKDEFPALHLIIAPRHLKRIEDAVIPFKEEEISRRTLIKEGRRNWRVRVFYLDTLGELSQFYGVSTIAVIGGSFFPGVEGHNPLESAALGVPTVFGSYMGNFSEAAAMLLKAGGAQQVQQPDELLPVLRNLLRNAVLRERIARKGRKSVLNSRGAVERNMAIILRYIQ